MNDCEDTMERTLQAALWNSGSSLSGQSDGLFQNRESREERLRHMMKSADGLLRMETDYVQEGSREERSGVGKERPLKQEKICLTRSSKIFPATTAVP